MRIENAMEKVILTKEEAIFLRDAYDIISDIREETENDKLYDVVDNAKEILENLLFIPNDEYKVYYEEPKNKGKILQISIDID